MFFPIKLFLQKHSIFLFLFFCHLDFLVSHRFTNTSPLYYERRNSLYVRILGTRLSPSALGIGTFVVASFLPGMSGLAWAGVLLGNIHAHLDICYFKNNTSHCEWKSIFYVLLVCENKLFKLRDERERKIPPLFFRRKIILNEIHLSGRLIKISQYDFFVARQNFFVIHVVHSLKFFGVSTLYS